MIRQVFKNNSHVLQKGRALAFQDISIYFYKFFSDAMMSVCLWQCEITQIIRARGATKLACV